MIFYMVEPNGIAVIGLPHQSMDISDYFVSEP